MMDGSTRSLDELERLLALSGLNSDSCEDNVQDSLVGILSGMRAEGERSIVADEDLVRWARYHRHLGALRRRVWWCATSAARRAAGEIDAYRSAHHDPMDAQDDPFHPERLGLDGLVMEAMSDLLRGPLRFDDVTDERYVTLRQDPRWIERDGRGTDEGPSDFPDRVRDAQHERSVERQARSRYISDRLDELPDTDRILLDLLFGVTVDPEPMEETLEFFDLTPSQFDRRLRRALGRLLHPCMSMTIALEEYGPAAPGDVALDEYVARDHLAQLAVEPEDAAETIVEVLWAAQGALPAGHVAAMVDCGLDAERLIEAARQDDRLSVEESGRIALRADAKSLVPWVWRWRRPAGERAHQVEVAARLLRAHRRPMSYTDLEQAVGAVTTIWNLRNALSSSRQFNRADRDVFALSHWKHEPYDSIEALMQRFISRNGGEASVKEIIDDLTARFTIKESSIRAYARTDAFVETRPGFIRDRREDEAVEESPSEVSALPDCFVKDGRWALRIPIDAKLLRGFSPVIPAGFAHHLGVRRRTSIRLETDIGQQISVVRKGMSDNMGRLRAVAETLNLSEGDILVVHAPRAGQGPVSFNAIRREELSDADPQALVALLLGIDDAGDRRAIAKALGLEARSTAFEILGTLRARGEPELASAVLRTLGIADEDGPATADIARVLGI
jgi:hypothetical protein